MDIRDDIQNDWLAKELRIEHYPGVMGNSGIRTVAERRPPERAPGVGQPPAFRRPQQPWPPAGAGGFGRDSRKAGVVPVLIAIAMGILALVMGNR